MIAIKRPVNLIIFVALITVIIWVLAAWFYFLYKPVITENQGIKFIVREGSSMRVVINELNQSHIINHPTFFKMLVFYKGVAHDLKAGEYFFQKGTTPPKLLSQIVTGTGMVYHAFTLVPGWNMHELRDALLQDTYLRHTIQNLSDEQLMAKLGYPKLKPEGQFFPDTYYFVANTVDLVLLKRAFKKMQQTLSIAWLHRASNLPFKNNYEALIGASIITKEADLDSELPKIAGVLINRINKNMLLQFDPTVIYGMGSRFAGTIHKSDLLEDTPFNTYVHKGLPPTPISMPNLAAIQAILHPEIHDYYYFVARGDGSHQFSKELQEHNKAVISVKKNRTTGFFNVNRVKNYLFKNRFDLGFNNGKYATSKDGLMKLIY